MAKQLENLNLDLFFRFIYSEKATKFCEIFTLLLSYVVPVKSKVKILQNFVAFSEYMNFTFGHFQNWLFFIIDPSQILTPQKKSTYMYNCIWVYPIWIQCKIC